MAQSTTELIIFRILQGLGGGMIAPIGMAMSFKIAPPDKEVQSWDCLDYRC